MSGINIDGGTSVQISSDITKVTDGSTRPRLLITSTGPSPVAISPPSGRVNLSGATALVVESAERQTTISIGGVPSSNPDDDVTFSRDGTGRILTATFDHGEVWTYDYTSGQLDQVDTNRSTDPVITYQRDGNGRISRIVYGSD